MAKQNKAVKKGKMRLGNSLAVRLVGMLVLLVAVALVTNILNVRSMKSMNDAAQEMAGDKLDDINNINTIIVGIESAQKNFYCYIASDKTSDGYKTSAEGYAQDKEEVAAAFEAFAANAGSEENQQKLMDFYSVVESAFSQMDKIMTEKDSGNKTMMNVELRNVTETIAEITSNVEGMKQQSEGESAASRETISATYSSASSTGMFLIIIVLVIGILDMAYILLKVVRPITKATKDLNVIVEEIQNGKGDLTRHIKCRSRDEVGQIVSGINQFMDVLKELIDKIKSGSTDLELAAEKVNTGVHAAGDKITDTSATMEELAASMQEVSASITDISGNIDAIKNEIEMMADKTREGLEYVDNISKKADEMKDNALTSQSNANSMVNQISSELTVAIEQSRQVDKINELTNEILSISSQTNLLALNASIEAARAGEAGKGFAVVADEIRQLADNSRNTANGIQEISKMVTESVANLSDNADKMLQFVNSDVLKDYDGMVESGETYHTDAQLMNDMMRDIQVISEKLKSAAEEIAEAASGVSMAVQQSAEGVGNAAEYTTVLASHMSDINDSMEANLNIADSLKGEVEGFQCE